MRGDIPRIVDAISLIEECRDNYPYRRTSDGGFEPAAFKLPTWVWHGLVVAMEEYCKLTGADLKGEHSNDGRIDQSVRAFRSVALHSDNPDAFYSYDGKHFHPPQISLPTAVWHEVKQLSHEQTAEWDRLDAFRPPTLKD